MQNEIMVELPKKGKAMIVTDIHGNLKDLEKYIKLWDDFQSKDNHLVLTGDFIHAMGLEDDKSIEVVITLKKLLKFDNVHLLLGNHEWSVISNVTIFKSGKNLSLDFEELLKGKFGSKWRKKLELCSDFFKKLPIMVRTKNKVFISHAGPPTNINSLFDLKNMLQEGYPNNSKLFEFLWNRYGDYSKKDIDKFLKIVDCKAMVVGHTPVKGFKMIGNNQLILSSSFSLGKKVYMELDLEKEIKKGKELLKMIKYID